MAWGVLGLVCVPASWVCYEPVRSHTLAFPFLLLSRSGCSSGITWIIPAALPLLRDPAVSHLAGAGILKTSTKLAAERQSGFSDGTEYWGGGSTLLVLAGIELIFFIVAGMGLCFGFVLKTVLIIQACFRYC